jgi:hypothetical protein
VRKCAVRIFTSLLAPFSRSPYPDAGRGMGLDGWLDCDSSPPDFTLKFVTWNVCRAQDKWISRVTAEHNFEMASTMKQNKTSYGGGKRPKLCLVASDDSHSSDGLTPTQPMA